MRITEKGKICERKRVREKMKKMPRGCWKNKSSKKEFRDGGTNKCGNHLHRCDNQSHDSG